MTGVGLPEEAGGSGGELADAVAVVATLAAGAAAVPVAEQLLVAAPAVLAADLDLPAPDEPLSIAVDGAVTAEPRDDGDGPGSWTLTGTATDVAWAGVARHLVVLATSPVGPVLALVDVTGRETTHAANLAGEPRGSLVFDGVTCAGALLTDAQAGERVQFGRPLGRFQAIQMELAEMAGEVTAVAALVDSAVQATERGESLVPAAAAAKVRAGAAVEVVARLAHQVHGAIGFTQEHRLHHLTRRCWSWRDEAGTELAWSRVLGERLLADGPDGLWPALTRVV
jgi:acyl-CoA dehydrogenase